MRIMLDAGHYGYQNRSPVVPEYYESRRMWLLCDYLAKELTKYGFEVGKTRNNIEVDLGLEQRGRKAKDYDLFISLHSNACGTESVDRVEVFAPLNNRNNSHALGKKLADEIAEFMDVSFGCVKTKNYPDKAGVEYYGVLRGACSVGCPLYYIIEHSFHTNTAATRWLLSDDNLRQLAILEAATIAEFFGVEIEEKIGDINADGEVNAIDYVLLKKVVLGTYQPTTEELKRCDINSDGKINAFDYILAKRIVLGTYTPEEKTESEETINIGDKVKIKKGVTKYANGEDMAAWVANGTFYVRDKEQNGKIYLISTQAEGNVYTGRVNSQDVIKLKK